jgi:nucleoside diphosphate kinase
MATTENWLPSLQTKTPQEGFDLAVKLARKTIGQVQPDEEVRRTLRNAYAADADSLIATSQVVAVNFQTIAAANDYWRGGR